MVKARDGEKLVKFKEQKGSQWEESLGRTGNDGGDVGTGRGQGEKLGLSSKGKPWRLFSRSDTL